MSSKFCWEAGDVVIVFTPAQPYVRSDDGARMIPCAPHSFVNEAAINDRLRSFLLKAANRKEAA